MRLWTSFSVSYIGKSPIDLGLKNRYCPSRHPHGKLPVFVRTANLKNPGLFQFTDLRIEFVRPAPEKEKVFRIVVGFVIDDRQHDFEKDQFRRIGNTRGKKFLNGFDNLVHGGTLCVVKNVVKTLREKHIACAIIAVPDTVTRATTGDAPHVKNRSKAIQSVKDNAFAIARIYRKGSIVFFKKFRKCQRKPTNSAYEILAVTIIIIVTIGTGNSAHRHLLGQVRKTHKTAPMKSV